MNILLDTHIVLWWLADDPSLSETARIHIANNENLVAVSSATVWEVAIKSAVGKLDVDDTWLDAVAADGFQQLPVQWAHADRVRRLPPIHKDPFDRLLIAQAIEERFVLLTADSTIPKYPVDCLPV